MPDPKFSLSMRSAGTEKKGEVSLKAGTTIKVSADDVGDLKVSADYEGEDELVVGVDGTFNLEVLGVDGVEVSGGLDHNIFDSTTKVKGAAEFKIAKDISAKIETSFAPNETTVGGSVTIRF